MISIFMIFRENNCEKEITVSNVILFLQNLSRGLINIAAKLTNTKDVRDFFIDLVEKVRFSLKKKKKQSAFEALCCNLLTSFYPTVY